ncbi:excalibur calcium-binding domain-containing protein [Aquibium sp. LZ166]|uniref:Excalibur calcium-binding domain-containing protein n=1 Tax=Aquibium pacificus TaxID=3153579 RepID=A0ABV3SLR1_9HYPH
MSKARLHVAKPRSTHSHRRSASRRPGPLPRVHTAAWAVLLLAIGLFSFAGSDFASLWSSPSPVAFAGSPPRTCSEARQRGLAPMTRWHPAYSAHLDRDRDGVACEPYFGR